MEDYTSDEKAIQEVADKIEDEDPEWIKNAEEKLPNENGNYELEVYLSTDGKHTVHIKVSDPKTRKEATRKAMELYEYILARYGTKQAQAVKEYGNGNKEVDQATCKHINVGFNQVKKEGPNTGKWFKSCKDCRKFLGWQ